MKAKWLELRCRARTWTKWQAISWLETELTKTQQEKNKGSSYHRTKTDINHRIEIEKRRKKAQKKKERLAAMDAAGERQKKSWQSFANKMVKKKKTGVVRKLR